MDRRVRQRVALSAFLLTPFVVLAIIMWFISVVRPQMNAPPVGAGSRSTGGANAIGEYLAHGSAKRHDTEPVATAGAKAIEHLVAPESLAQGFVLVVRDQAGLATPESPISIACNLNNWSSADPAWKLVQQADGSWLLAVAHPANGQTLIFRFMCAGRGELDAQGDEISGRRLAVVDASALAPGEQPRIELSVNRWAGRPLAGADAKK
jgi:hypothetical protein